MKASELRDCAERVRGLSYRIQVGYDSEQFIATTLVQEKLVSAASELDELARQVDQAPEQTEASR